MKQISTYEATFASGWRATVREADAAGAHRRFLQTGRGEAFRVAATSADRHSVWGRDEDDDYEDGE